MFGSWWKDVLSGASAGAARDLIRATEGGLVEGIRVLEGGLSSVQGIVRAASGAADTVLDAFDGDDEEELIARRRREYEREELRRCQCDCNYTPRVLGPVRPERAETPARPERRKKATRKKATRKKTTRRKKATRRRTR